MDVRLDGRHALTDEPPDDRPGRLGADTSALLRRADRPRDGRTQIAMIALDGRLRRAEDPPVVRRADEPVQPRFLPVG